MKLLVFGGAGFIGGTTAQLLAAAGHEVTVFDNLSTSTHKNVGDLKLIKGDICDNAAVEAALGQGYDAVMHFAGKLLVGESTKQPHVYYRVNVLGSLNVIEASASHKLPIIFSSSAAVYGEPDAIPIKESAATHPTSPYGWTKLMVEQLLASYQATHGLRWIALRYFNAAGAHDKIGDHTPDHIIPAAFAALKAAKPVKLFGDDYPTPDGSCIRDYVHVDDLARAHILAATELIKRPVNRAINLGTSHGASVKEVLDAIDNASGRKLKRQVAPRRSGDPARLLASIDLANELLNWQPQKSLKDIVEDAWQWQQHQN